MAYIEVLCWYVGENTKKAFAVSGATLCFTVLFTMVSLEVSASAYSNSTDFPEFTFSDLLREWMNAVVDPATYTAWMQIDGFYHFLSTETFLSVFSSNAYGSLDRDTMLGTIPNVFLVVCIITAVLCVTVAVVGIRRAGNYRHAAQK